MELVKSYPLSSKSFWISQNLLKTTSEFLLFLLGETFPGVARNSFEDSHALADFENIFGQIVRNVDQ
jgi:hypothetical protein